ARRHAIERLFFLFHAWRSLDHFRMALGGHLRGGVRAVRLVRRRGAGGSGDRARLWTAHALPAARAFANICAAHGEGGCHAVSTAHAGTAARAGVAGHGGLGGRDGTVHGSAWASAILGPAAAGVVGQSARQRGAGARSDRAYRARGAAARGAQRMAAFAPAVVTVHSSRSRSVLPDALPRA